ncbi:MAG: LysR family transcriptional regulator [Streptosporangiaceae bacterium]|nr:LysR family transcriptional regulator [Streptosporangiaceae bacterium]
MVAVDTELLRVFRDVAQHGSFTAAARGLGYTQSAVSRQISVLENEFGAPLFDRLARGVRLTESGRSLLPHAEAVLQRVAVAAADIQALRHLDHGRLRVGAFPTADAALVPRAVAAFRQAHPGVELMFAEGFVRDLVVRVSEGGLDVAVVTSTVTGLVEGLELRHVMDDQMFVAVHPSHPAASRDVIRLADLAEDDWIAGSSRLEETLFAAAEGPGQSNTAAEGPGQSDATGGTPFRPRIRYVIREWVAKQGFVAAGLGVTLIPSLAMGSARPDVVLVPLHPDDSPIRKVYAATPAAITPPAALASFLGFLDDAAAEVVSRASGRGS